MGMPKTKRKDIETLDIILKAIERVERDAVTGDVVTAGHLDSLYTALKSQAATVIELQKMDDLDLKIAN